MKRARAIRNPNVTRRRLLAGSAAIVAQISAAPGRAAAQSGRASGVPWKPAAPPAAGMAALQGHTDTVLDIVGRVGGPTSLAIFTEGNHFPVLLGGEILEPFRSWARRDARFAAIDLVNIVVVTLPQPMIVAMVLGRGLVLGNLMLDVSRESGFFPDMVMGGTTPLKRLHEAGVVEGAARVFARNRGLSLVVRNGNPSQIAGVGDLKRPDVRIVVASASEPGARRQYMTALEAMLGREAADAIMAREIGDFAGRLGIQHRDVPHAVATGIADVGIIFHHLAQHYATTYPDIFQVVTAPDAERFSSTIAMAPAVNPLRSAAARAFAEYFLGIAGTVYPRYGFATMNGDEYGASVAL